MLGTREAGFPSVRIASADGKAWVLVTPSEPEATFRVEFAYAGEQGLLLGRFSGLKFTNARGFLEDLQQFVGGRWLLPQLRTDRGISLEFYRSPSAPAGQMCRVTYADSVDFFTTGHAFRSTATFEVPSDALAHHARALSRLVEGSERALATSGGRSGGLT